MWATLNEARFDEHGRIRELIAQGRARREQSVTGSGHSLAMAAACSGMSPSARISHQLNGLEGIKSLKALDDSLNEPTELAAFCDRIAQVHRLILAAPRQYLLVSDREHLDSSQAELQKQWSAPETNKLEKFSLPPVSSQEKQAWLTNTQVNFCAKAYPTVPVEHPDSAALTVLGGFLRNGNLHRTIREQGGAYGGGASQDNNIAAFRFFSYRDPRLLETFADFEQSLEWLQNEEHDPQTLEEAVLGIISSLDKPSSPAGEAKQTFHAELFNRTREKREDFRKRVLAVTVDDLQRVARTYLIEKNASYGVVTHAGNREAVEQLGLHIHTL